MNYWNCCSSKSTLNRLLTDQIADVFELSGTQSGDDTFRYCSEISAMLTLKSRTFYFSSFIMIELKLNNPYFPALNNLSAFWKHEQTVHPVIWPHMGSSEHVLILCSISPHRRHLTEWSYWLLLLKAEWPKSLSLDNVRLLLPFQ